MGFSADEPKALPWARMNDALGVTQSPPKPWLNWSGRILSCACRFIISRRFPIAKRPVPLLDFGRMANPIPAETADLELVRQAQAGDLDAFEALASRYEQRIYSLALRMLRQEQDAEDVTQQTFLSALEHLSGFRGEASFSTWLLRIASHAALKVIRKRKGLDTVSLEEATEPAGEYDNIPHPEY